jgi:hypothetical protein
MLPKDLYLLMKYLYEILIWVFKYCCRTGRPSAFGAQGIVPIFFVLFSVQLFSDFFNFYPKKLILKDLSDELIAIYVYGIHKNEGNYKHNCPVFAHSVYVLVERSFHFVLVYAMSTINELLRSVRNKWSVRKFCQTITGRYSRVSI